MISSTTPKSVYARKAAATITKAADPATLSLFKTAPLVAGAGACDPDGVAAIDGGLAAGDADGDTGGEGGELTVAGDGAVADPLSTGAEAVGEFADGVTATGAGAIALLGAAVGDVAGEEAGDCCAIVELTSKAATSINTILELAIVEIEKEKTGILERVCA
ncbi:uncharacterized protein LOC129285583 [Prosopis cineraria]|uniref:uncharacterized protein LOC129285583 n=1 Tax=Prosopis cineraria TaxID=364024 RepID=UPI0024100901|nr:uncharacterized protein LOC129285583 [Prosopis cineraria]